MIKINRTIPKRCSIWSKTAKKYCSGRPGRGRKKVERESGGKAKARDVFGRLLILRRRRRRFGGSLRETRRRLRPSSSSSQSSSKAVIFLCVTIINPIFIYYFFNPMFGLREKPKRVPELLMGYCSLRSICLFSV